MHSPPEFKNSDFDLGLQIFIADSALGFKPIGNNPGADPGLEHKAIVSPPTKQFWIRPLIKSNIILLEREAFRAVFWFFSWSHSLLLQASVEWIKVPRVVKIPGGDQKTSLR